MTDLQDGAYSEIQQSEGWLHNDCTQLYVQSVAKSQYKRINKKTKDRNLLSDGWKQKLLLFTLSSFLFCFCASHRLKRPVQPQRGGSSARESVCVFRGLLQTEIPWAARQVCRRMELCTSPDSGVQKEKSNPHIPSEREREIVMGEGSGVCWPLPNKQSLPPPTHLKNITFHLHLFWSVFMPLLFWLLSRPDFTQY